MSAFDQSGHAMKDSRSEGWSVSGGFARYAVRSLFPLRSRRIISTATRHRSNFRLGSFSGIIIRRS